MSNDHNTMGLTFDSEFVTTLHAALDKAAQNPPKRAREHLTADLIAQTIRAAAKRLEVEGTLVQVSPRHDDTVYIIGDLHGQFHDVQHILTQLKQPTDKTLFVFNGDYVDRGSRSVEVLVLLCAWKAVWPDRVVLLRGNHETRWCNKSYGFYAELRDKFGASGSRMILHASEEMFRHLPLACRIGAMTLVLHGGIPRRLGSDQAASLSDIQHSTKGGPNGDANSLVSDILWSDPQGKRGTKSNHWRGQGMLFGPDMTETFLKSNGLRLVIRAHETPMYRFMRAKEDTALPTLWEGYSVDHDTPAGKLITVFSCPDPEPPADPDAVLSRVESLQTNSIALESLCQRCHSDAKLAESFRGLDDAMQRLRVKSSTCNRQLSSSICAPHIHNEHADGPTINSSSDSLGESGPTGGGYSSDNSSDSEGATPFLTDDVGDFSIVGTMAAVAVLSGPDFCTPRFETFLASNEVLE